MYSIDTWWHIVGDQKKHHLLNECGHKFSEDFLSTLHFTCAQHWPLLSHLIFSTTPGNRCCSLHLSDKKTKTQVLTDFAHSRSHWYQMSESLILKLVPEPPGANPPFLLTQAPCCFSAQAPFLTSSPCSLWFYPMKMAWFWALSSGSDSSAFVPWNQISLSNIESPNNWKKMSLKNKERKNNKKVLSDSLPLCLYLCIFWTTSSLE